MRFRLAPRSMTFHDIDLNSLGISRDFADLISAKRMRIYPNCHRQNFQPVCTKISRKRYV